MISKNLQKLLSDLGLTLSGVVMGVHTRKVSVWLSDENRNFYLGSSEKGEGVSSVNALDRAVGSALSANFPGWSALWLRSRRIEKKDPYTEEVLEVVS